MAEYSNPQLPEEVNNSDTRPLRSFLVLASATLVFALAAAALLAFFGGSFARYLPYALEVRLAEPYARRMAPGDAVVEGYLQGLAARLSPGMDLPAGMQIRVHYIDEPMVNAFATLGGHVAVYRGLLERLPDENTLAMVLAHEIGHAGHRHAIASLGRGVAFGAAVSVVSAGAGSRVAESVLGNAGLLTLLSFSRSQEEEADSAGLAAPAARLRPCRRRFGHLQAAARGGGRARRARTAEVPQHPSAGCRAHRAPRSPGRAVRPSGRRGAHADPGSGARSDA
ncbi:MAG: M48 family metalloprotease, partial [Betaproteobacteria bacterium]|nr:M48 family metalloprotease [Betaproteobacteria bacterium]